MTITERSDSTVPRDAAGARAPGHGRSSAPARPAWRRRTTWARPASPASSSTSTSGSATSGGSGTTRCCSTPRRSTTGCPACRSPRRGAATRPAREMGDHLERYVERDGHRRPLRASRVRAVDRQPDGGWLAHHVGRRPARRQRRRRQRRRARCPRVPDVAGDLDPGIRQLHSSGYRNPGQLLPGPVLVVGAGQSGADIALEIARAGPRDLAVGPGDAGGAGALRVAPDADRRCPVLWFLANHVLTVRTPMGRRHAAADPARAALPLVRVRRADLEAAGVHLTEARTVGADDGRPVLADGTVLDVANVVWCTGFRQEFGLVRPDVTGDDGYPRGRRRHRRRTCPACTSSGCCSRPPSPRC